MPETRCVAVIDIGKTNAKVALVDIEDQAEIAVRKRPNAVLHTGAYPHFDTEALWAFVLDALRDLGATHRIDAVSVTTHGATAALLDANGELALPVLDYEHDGPDALDRAYNAIRPPFSESGSPRLPGGLNIGAQLFWQERSFPDQWDCVRQILTYAQYWSFRLTGVATTEATSLGCHTDLWSPGTRNFSSLVDKLSWRELFAPVRAASDRLGAITAEVAERTGLPAHTPVYCGIHDSNASLLPHVLFREPPFSVISTGTWVVVMSMGGRAEGLDPGRDTLINVNALGEPVPSARFMGGRENALLTDGLSEGWSEADVQAVLDGPILLLPSVQGGSGPFPDCNARWMPGKPDSAAEQRVAAAFYLALMTATCLELTGANGPVIIEGPFASNRLFLEMLATATGRPVIRQSGSTGTSVGAALLAGDWNALPSATGETVQSRPEWRPYADAWRAAVAEG